MVDDDLKFSMDDIKDMVSEYFGEKVEKVEAADAKKIISRESEESLTEGVEELQNRFTDEEKSFLSEIAREKLDAAEVFESGKEPEKARGETADIETLKKKIEEETREKLESEMREKISRELKEESSRKREEILKKIEDAKPAEPAINPKYKDAVESTMAKLEAGADEKKNTVRINYNEIMDIVNMFEISQQFFRNILSKIIKKKPVATMFLKTLEKAMKNNPDILKKADVDRKNKTKGNGSIEPARIFSNMNALAAPEDKKTVKFFNALKDIFEERIIATELAAGIETKDEVMSNIVIQSEKFFAKKEFSKKLQKIFKEHVLPDTSLKPGE
ncbi:MAG: hypothetical protein ACLFP1_04760 [Candidatus Goldiibacteriota bacterium]